MILWDQENMLKQRNSIFQKLPIGGLLEIILIPLLSNMESLKNTEELDQPKLHLHVNLNQRSDFKTN